MRSVIVVLCCLLFSISASAQVMDGCPVNGDGGDPGLNKQKNRTEVAASFEHIPLSRLKKWTRPAGSSKGKPRSQWPESAQDKVAERESLRVEVIGYLIAQRLEGPETCNCHSDSKADYDTHMWITSAADDEKPLSVVSEVTPLVREQHPTWTTTTLKNLVGKRVRISGDVLFDQEHPEQLGVHRASLWEIHPIMKIEVYKSGAWHEI